MQTNTRIGIVGLGNMGGSMARHLVDEEWTVVGYDADSAVLAEESDYGVVQADSPADLASRVEIVITSLPTPASVKSVYLGDDGLAESGGCDLVALEMSTVPPDVSESIVESSSLALVDAPVSGGPRKAREGSLTIMAGGDKATFESERVRAALDSLGEHVHHLGDVGAGYTTKLLNNQIGAGIRAITLEAASVAAVKGVEWDAFMDAVRHSSGSSYQFRKRMPRVLSRNFDPGFRMDATRKDVRLALEMADEADSPAYLTSAVYELYKRAVAEGLEDEDTAAIVKLFEQHTGVPVKADEPVDEDYLDWKDI